MHRIHLIGGSSGAVTAEDAAAAVTIAGCPPRWTAMLATFFLAVLPGLQVAQDSPTVPPRGHILAAVAYLVLAAAVSVWGGWRGRRMRLRLDDHGATIRDFFWNGSAWSPFIQPDPPGRGPEEGKAPGESWSPLRGSVPQWQDAASRASRAGIWLALWLAVTAAAMIVTVLLYTQDLSKPRAGFTAAVWVLIAAAFGLLRTYGAWQQRKSLTKIDQARRAARLADTGEVVSADRFTRWRPR
jgi:FtsH-binding integral membrane protein